MENHGLPKIFLFGGSFNPVHVGHTALIEGVGGHFKQAHIFVIPARVSPFKQHIKQHARQLPDELRLAMLRAALEGMSRVSLIDMEMRQPSPSYTIHTVRRLSSQLPRAEMYWTMGTDVFREFASWYHASDILNVVNLLVVSRRGEPQDGLTPCSGALGLLPSPWQERLVPTGQGLIDPQSDRRVVRFLDIDLPAVSSSGILSHNTLQDVPSRARALLEEHWKSGASS